MQPTLALWSPLLQRAVLNYFASVTNRHSEQLDNNMEAGKENSSIYFHFNYADSAPHGFESMLE